MRMFLLPVDFLAGEGRSETIKNLILKLEETFFEPRTAIHRLIIQCYGAF